MDHAACQENARDNILAANHLLPGEATCSGRSHVIREHAHSTFCLVMCSVLVCASSISCRRTFRSFSALQTRNNTKQNRVTDRRQSHCTRSLLALSVGCPLQAAVGIKGLNSALGVIWRATTQKTALQQKRPEPLPAISSKRVRVRTV